MTFVLSFLGWPPSFSKGMIKSLGGLPSTCLLQSFLFFDVSAFDCFFSFLVPETYLTLKVGIQLHWVRWFCIILHYSCYFSMSTSFY